MLSDMRKRYPQQELAERLNDALKDAEIIPAELARQCGVTPQAVHDWQTTGRIGKQHLLTICRVTKKPIEYFLVGLGRAAILVLGLLFIYPPPATAVQTYSEWSPVYYVKLKLRMLHCNMKRMFGTEQMLSILRLLFGGSECLGIRLPMSRQS